MSTVLFPCRDDPLVMQDRLEALILTLARVSSGACKNRITLCLHRTINWNYQSNCNNRILHWNYLVPCLCFKADLSDDNQFNDASHDVCQSLTARCIDSLSLATHTIYPYDEYTRMDICAPCNFHMHGINALTQLVRFPYSELGTY